MKLEEAISHAGIILRENPNLKLTGSLSLIIAYAIKPRDVHDLDFVYVGKEPFNPEGYKQIHYASTNHDSDTYEKEITPDFKYNVFVPKEETLLVNINGIEMVAPFIALEWKARMARPKDIQDGYNGQF